MNIWVADQILSKFNHIVRLKINIVCKDNVNAPNSEARRKEAQKNDISSQFKLKIIELELLS